MKQIDYLGTLFRRVEVDDGIMLRFSAHAIDVPPSLDSILAVTVHQPRFLTGSWAWLEDAEIDLLEHTADRLRIHVLHEDEPVEVDGRVMVEWQEYDLGDYRLMLERLIKSNDDESQLRSDMTRRINAAIAALEQDEAAAEVLADAYVGGDRHAMRHRNLVKKIRRILSGES